MTETKQAPFPSVVCSPLANPRATRAALERHGLVAKHRLGQNFLVDDSVVSRILKLAELSKADTVLEVGPGMGTLTCALLPRVKKVIAVEADHTLEAVLAETCAQNSDCLEILWGDALKVLPSSLGKAQPAQLVSNLPYQVAATLILRVLSELPSIKRVVVMVQAEVADRIAAVPGNKTYGAYTAKLGLYAQVTGRFEVSHTCFMPAPHVESAVVRIDRRPLTPDVDFAFVSQVIDAAFAQRRKTIRNSMAANGFDKKALDTAFKQAHIQPACRAEMLAVEDFIQLARVLELKR